MEKILAKARKVAEEAEVYMTSTQQTSVQFEANRLKHMQTRQSTHVGLRIVKDGRIGYASSSSLEKPDGLVRMAVETAQFGQQARFQFPGAADLPKVDVYDGKVEAVSIDKMARLGDEMIAAIRKNTPEIQCEGGVESGIHTTVLMNARGGQANYKTSVFSMGIEGTLVRGTDMLFVGESAVDCHALSDAHAISGTVIKQLEMAKDIASVANGQLPVIFTPNGVAGTLLGSLMVGFNGKIVFEGASAVGKRQGEQVFDDKLSIWDDATLPFRPTSRPCDDEGVPSRRTTLIENGRVANFLYDLQTAGLAGKQSTGSGVRQGGLPGPGPAAIVFGTGNTTMDEMVRDMKEGVIIEQLLGAGQSNILGGDFSGNVLLGYKVENGRVVGRIKNAIVSGNVYQILKQITAIGSEAKWVGARVHCPPILCPAISIATKG